MIFKIIGSAAESANFPLAFNIEEYIEEILINTPRLGQEVGCLLK